MLPKASDKGKIFKVVREKYSAHRNKNKNEIKSVVNDNSSQKKERGILKVLKKISA